MKRLPLLIVLVVAFIFSAVFGAEAKILHFEIDGVPYAAVKKADGRLESFEVTAEYHAKFKNSAPQAKIVQPTKNENLKKATYVRPEEKTTHKRLADWKVMEATYVVNKKGEKKLVKTSLRSPTECFEKVEPGMANITATKSLPLYVERYDKHTYIESNEQPVAAGTVVYLMLDKKPDQLLLNHIVRDADRDKMEVLNNESGQFAVIDKSEALKVTYLSDNEKVFERAKIVPAKELYDYSESRKITPAEAAELCQNHAKMRSG